MGEKDELLNSTPLPASLERKVDSSIEKKPQNSSSSFLNTFLGRSEFVVQGIILLAICVLAFCIRLFSVVRYESMIHEFDPWFNFRSTKYLVSEGFYAFHNWFDNKAWYPMGRFVGGSVYPGLMWTAAVVYHFLQSALHFTVDIRNVCVFISPLFASFTSLATYFLAKEMWNGAAGITAAAFIALTPGYISRSVAGSYDNEAVAIFALVFCFFLWTRAVNTGSMVWALFAALGYFNMVAAWGGYVFIINIIPLHALALLVLGRFSSRLYIAYSVFYILGTVLSMQVLFVSFQPASTSPEHAASLLVFCVFQFAVVARWLNRLLSSSSRLLLFRGTLCAGAVGGISFLAAAAAGKVPFFTARLLSLLGSTSNIAIVKSVSEHQPSPWTTFFFDLHFVVLMVPVGIFFCLRYISDAGLFGILYAVFAAYFASIMIRLVLVLTPIACIFAGIGVSVILSTYCDVLAGVGLVSISDEIQTDIAIDTNIVDSNKHEVDAGAGAGADGNLDMVDNGDEKLVHKQNNSQHHKNQKTLKIDESQHQPSPSPSPSSPSITPITQETTKTTKTTKTTPKVSRFVAMSVLSVFGALFYFFVIHCSWVTSTVYSSPTIVLMANGHQGEQIIFDDFREAYSWLRNNTPEDSKVMSWWDYGYQITGMADRTVIVDNNTRNNTHIATVGLALASNEERAYEVMKLWGVDYVMVVFGGAVGYSSDDINKFVWILRITGGVHPEIVEAEYFNSGGQYRVDSTASQTMKDSLMYKMCYHRFNEYGRSGGMDRVRQAVISEPVELEYIEEAYTTEHWMVRIYKIKNEKTHPGFMEEMETRKQLYGR